MTRILIARITGAHGVRGQVKIRSFTDDPKSFAAYGPLTTTAGSKIEITKAAPAKDQFICTLRNITDRNAAEMLRGSDLFIARDQLPAEPVLADLVGRPVAHQSRTLGTIIGFQNFGAGELIELDSGLLIPLRFATPGDPVTVDLPDGFLDTEENLPPLKDRGHPD
jgi:16S rRNA processing protein RimM